MGDENHENLVWESSAINPSECGSSTGSLWKSITTVVSYKIDLCKVFITAERFQVVKFWWISFKVNDEKAHNHKTSLSGAIPYQNHALCSEQASREVLNVFTGVQHDPQLAFNFFRLRYGGKAWKVKVRAVIYGCSLKSVSGWEPTRVPSPRIAEHKFKLVFELLLSGEGTQNYTTTKSMS